MTSEGKGLQLRDKKNKLKVFKVLAKEKCSSDKNLDRKDAKDQERHN